MAQKTNGSSDGRHVHNLHRQILMRKGCTARVSRSIPVPGWMISHCPTGGPLLQDAGHRLQSWRRPRLRGSGKTGEFFDEQTIDTWHPH